MLLVLKQKMLFLPFAINIYNVIYVDEGILSILVYFRKEQTFQERNSAAVRCVTFLTNCHKTKNIEHFKRKLSFGPAKKR